MSIHTLEELFIHDLSDIYSAEQQIVRSLPKMARAAADKKLAEAFMLHLDESRGHIERLDELIELTDGLRRKRIKCHALEGLVLEAEELIESVEKGPVRDAGLIGAAQKVEHYEIAAYGTLRAMALRLGYERAAELLSATLHEEKSTDEKLTTLAEQSPL